MGVSDILVCFSYYANGSSKDRSSQKTSTIPKSSAGPLLHHCAFCGMGKIAEILYHTAYNSTTFYYITKKLWCGFRSQKRAPSRAFPLCKLILSYDHVSRDKKLTMVLDRDARRPKLQKVIHSKITTRNFQVPMLNRSHFLNQGGISISIDHRKGDHA